MFFWLHDGKIQPVYPSVSQRTVPHVFGTHPSTPVREKQANQGSLFHHQKPENVYTEGAQNRERPVFFVKEIMSSPVFCLPERESISQAKAFLKEKKLRHLPIVSELGDLVGFASDRDLWDKDPELPLSSVMRKEVLFAGPLAEIRNVTAVLLKFRIGALPILEEKKPIGILTRSDLLRLLLKYPGLDLMV